MIVVIVTTASVSLPMAFVMPAYFHADRTTSGSYSPENGAGHQCAHQFLNKFHQTTSEL